MARSAEPTKNSGFLILASISLVVAGLYFGREVLIPIALAILVSFLLTPAVRWLERIRVPRALAMIICVSMAVGVVGGIGYVVYHQLTSIVDALPQYEGELRGKFHHIGQHFGFFKRIENEAKAITAGTSANPSAQNPASRPSSPQSSAPAPPSQTWSSDNPLPARLIPQPAKTWELLRDFAGTVLSPLATAALVLVLVCFMLISREDLRDRLIRLLGSARLNLTTQALDEASTRISSYLVSLSIVNFCCGTWIALGLWMIGKVLGGGQGFPNVLVWGILVAVLRFVPYVGIWIAASFPILLSFAFFPGNSVFLATIALFGTMEAIVGQFIEPKFYGSTTGMSPLAVLVAAVFWTWLRGPIGLLLSTPLTVILVVMGKYIPQLKFIEIMLREEPVLSPPFRLYQRLLSMDQDDGSELARDYLKENRSLIETYDDLLVPVLAMAEADSHHERSTTDQRRFVCQGVRDIAEELADQFRELLEVERNLTGEHDAVELKPVTALESAATTVATVASTVAAAMTGGGKSTGDAREADKAYRIRHLPDGCKITVICLPARDEADDVVAYMLAQVLEIRRYCVVNPSSASLASEMVEMVESNHADLVCISAMPPAAVAHSRYICKRIHARFPDIAMVVALWMAKTDSARAKDRIACSKSVRVVKSLREATEQIEEYANSRIVQSTARQGSETTNEPNNGEVVAGSAQIVPG